WWAGRRRDRRNRRRLWHTAVSASPGGRGGAVRPATDRGALSARDTGPADRGVGLSHFAPRPLCTRSARFFRRPPRKRPPGAEHAVTPQTPRGAGAATAPTGSAPSPGGVATMRSAGDALTLALGPGRMTRFGGLAAGLPRGAARGAGSVPAVIAGFACVGIG